MKDSKIFIIVGIIFLIIVIIYLVYYKFYENYKNKNNTLNECPPCPPCNKQHSFNIINNNVKKNIIRKTDHLHKKLMKKPSMLGQFIHNANKKSEPKKMRGIFTKKREDRNPLIIIPGLGGTQLVTENTNWEQFQDCNFHESVDGTIWVSVNPPPGGLCQLELLKAVYDRTESTLNTNPFTNIKVNGEEGSVYSCYCLNDTLKCLAGGGKYMKDLVELLEDVGYKDLHDLFAVGYDFRLVPYGNVIDYSTFTDKNNHFGEFFLRIKRTIERAYTNTGKKVFLLGHSMGGFMGNLFLNVCRHLSSEGYIPNNWIETYIEGFIPVAAAFEGGPKSLRGILSGANPGTPFGSNLQWKQTERRIMGIITLCPLIKEAYEDDVAIKIKHLKSGTTKIFEVTNDIDPENSTIVKILKSINEYDMEIVSEIYESVIEAKILALKDPKVPVYLIYGDNLETETGGYEYIYDDSINLDDDPISLTFGKGDGTVPLSILRFPYYSHTYNYDGETVNIEPWSMLKPAYIVNNKDGEHLEIIKSNSDVHEYILNIISK